MGIKLFKKYPAVFSVIPLAAGIVFSYLFKFDLTQIGFTNLLIIQFIIAVLVLYAYSGIQYSFRRYLALFCILLFVFGMLRFDFKYNRYMENNIAAQISLYQKKDVMLFGSVTDEPEVKDDRVRMIIKADSVKSGETALNVNGNIQAVIYKNRYRESVPKKINYGDKIQLSGMLEKLPHRKNPGEFDYGEYLRLHGIDAQFVSFGFENIFTSENKDAGFYYSKIIYPLKNYSVNLIDKLIGGQEGEFLKGLVLGERSNISKETKEEFTNAGVSHIIAVSGLNVAYVILIIGGLLLIIPVNRTVKIFVMIIFLVFYMNLTGNVPSIVRATIMASVFLLSQVFERKTISYNIIAFSAIVILLIDPQQLFDAGFILSYSAILSIVYFYPKLNLLVSSAGLYSFINKDKQAHKIIRGTVTLILGTLAAQIGTLPITALMFKKISTVSLFTNIIAIPLSNIALAVGFVMIIFSSFSVWLAQVFAGSADFLLHWLLKFISFSANNDFSFIETYRADWLPVIFYYLVIFILFTSKKENFVPRAVIAALLVLNFFVVSSMLNKSSKVELAYLDTGNSSSCLITSPSGENVLINAGTSSAEYTSAERNVIPYLKRRGVKELDLLILTSLNRNEFRNLIYFVKNFPVKKIIVPGYYSPLFTADEFKNFFNKLNIEFVNQPEKHAEIPRLRFYLVYDNKRTGGTSMLVHFVYGKEVFTFSDTRKLNEEFLYSTIAVSDTTEILKVPASGSFNFTSPEYIVTSNPKNIVISSSRASKRLNTDIFSGTMERIGIDVYKINENGAVLFETDGENAEQLK